MRQSTRDIGSCGEKRARQFLEQRGYQIKARNWRFKRYEIDIVASFEDLLVFVEVKTRSSNDLTKPEAAVTMSQWGNIARAAGAYMVYVDYDWEVRFDIIAINSKKEIEHFEDAFH